MAFETTTFYSVLLFVFFCNCVCHEDASHEQDCNVWTQIAREIEMEPRLSNATCGINDKCTGVDCNAIYSYTALSVPVASYNICFGLFLNPCNDPVVDLAFYLEVPDKNLSHSKNYSEDSLTPINGLVFDTKYGSLTVQAQGYLATDFERYQVGQHTIITIGMRFRAKTEVTVYGQRFSRWLSDMQVVLVPDVNVTSPHCSPSTQLPPHTEGECTVFREAAAVVSGGEGPNTPCHLNVWGTCGSYERCMSGGANGSFCVCSINAVYDEKKKACIPDEEYVSFVEPSDSVTPKKSHSNRTRVVAGIVGGVLALVLLVAGAGALVLYYRKRNSGLSSTAMRLHDESIEEDD